MPKYWGKQIFTHGRFPEVGQKQKTEREKERRPKLGNNNGQLCIAMPPRVAHAKPPGPMKKVSHNLKTFFNRKYNTGVELVYSSVVYRATTILMVDSILESSFVLKSVMYNLHLRFKLQFFIKYNLMPLIYSHLDPYFCCNFNLYWCF